MTRSSSHARIASDAASAARNVTRNSVSNDNSVIAASSQGVTINTASSRPRGTSRASLLGDTLMTHAIQAQRAFWNTWNAANREQRLSEISLDQRDLALRWLSESDRSDLNIIEVGCGAGWMCPSMKPFGHVTATDLSDEVLARAALRVPDVGFVAGDFMELLFAKGAYDAVVSLEVLAHVADHDAFIAKMASLLKPGGRLILATQNRPVLERYNAVKPQADGQLRRWFDRRELHELLSRYLIVREIRTITPFSNKGVTRLVAGRVARRAMRMTPGRIVERAMAPKFGWTLMALAEKPVLAE